MLGMSSGNIRYEIESELRLLRLDAKLQNILERLSEGVAKAIEANNQQIERDIESKFRRI